MKDRTYPAIESLLCSTRPADLLAALGLIRAELPRAGAPELKALAELVFPLFYIDTLDHPEHVPVIEEAIEVVASMGEAVVPVLVQNLESGDLKAQMAMAQSLGHMGAPVIEPLLAEYRSGCGDPGCRAFLLFALGKVKSPEIVKAADVALEAVCSEELELRDTATRAIGKFVESIPAGSLPAHVRDAFVAQLRARLADRSPGVRAKAVRSLGKLARYGHLDEEQRKQFQATIRQILGEDDFEWDRAYVVRKEAQEALGYL